MEVTQEGIDGGVMLPTGPWRLSDGWTWRKAASLMQFGRPYWRARWREADGGGEHKAVLPSGLAEQIKDYLSDRYVVVKETSRTVLLLDLCVNAGGLGRPEPRDIETVASEWKEFDAPVKAGKEGEQPPPKNVVLLWFEERKPAAVPSSAYMVGQPWPFYTDPLSPDQIVLNRYAPTLTYIRHMAELEAGADFRCVERVEDTLGAALRQLFEREEDLAYFLKVIGWKVKHPETQMPLIVLESLPRFGHGGARMGAQAQGTGRGTVIGMVLLRTLMGSGNVVNLSVDNLFDDKNFYEGIPFLFISEAAEGRRMRKATAEKIKAIFDPGIGQDTTRRALYAAHAQVPACKLGIMCSNTARTLPLHAGDRRVWVARTRKVDDDLRLRLIAASSDHNWQGTAIEWLARHAFASLQEALAAPPMTDAKDDAIEEAEGQHVELEALDAALAAPALVNAPILTWPLVEVQMRICASNHDRRHMIGDGLKTTADLMMLQLTPQKIAEARNYFEGLAEVVPARLPDNMTRREWKNVMRIEAKALARNVTVRDREPLYLNPRATADVRRAGEKLLLGDYSARAGASAGLKPVERRRAKAELSHIEAALRRLLHPDAALHPDDDPPPPTDL